MASTDQIAESTANPEFAYCSPKPPPPLQVPAGRTVPQCGSPGLPPAGLARSSTLGPRLRTGPSFGRTVTHKDEVTRRHTLSKSGAIEQRKC